MKRRFLGKEKVGPVQRQVAVHLISGHLVVTLNAIGAACVQQCGGSHNIGPYKALGIRNGAVHMAFRRKVNDHIRLFLFKQVKDKLPVGNITLYKLVVRLVLYRFYWK